MVLGATITAVELPTAFPYFAAIAAIIAADVDPAQSLILLLLFNVCFILPLLGMIGTLTFAGDRSERMLAVGREFLQRHWPAVLAGLALVAGLFIVFLGASGFAGSGHTPLSRMLRHLRGVLHP